MIATISIVCFNKCDVTKKCLESLNKTLPREGVEIIITNNGSLDETESIVFSSELNNKVYIQYGKNMGFIKAHNEALKLARGNYFVALNNDIILNEPDWLYKLLKPLEDESCLKLVGFSNVPCSLKSDAHGYIGREVEYIDGACIAGRTEDFLKYGLFSDDYEMFYCEDSDLSLRFRQMGFGIHAVPIGHKHVRSSTANTLNKGYRDDILAKNKEVFLKKWKNYLRNRMFTNNILVKATSQGYGDIICITPLIEAIRREHPTSRIEVETMHPEVFQNNPYISEISAPRTKYTLAYDRIIDFTLNYASYDLIVKEASKVAGVHVDNLIPQLFITNEELDFGIEIVNHLKTSDDQFVVCCATQMARTQWQGRNWGFEETSSLIRKMREMGLIVIEIGKGIKSTGEADIDLVDKTSLRELFSIIASVDLFIGIDSGPFHIAQAFEIPSYVIFGATEPATRIVNFENTFPIRDENLLCIGCYMRKGISNWNTCNMGNELCMNNITPEMVIAHITGEIDSKTSNISYLQKILNFGWNK